MNSAQKAQIRNNGSVLVHSILKSENEIKNAFPHFHNQRMENKSIGRSICIIIELEQSGFHDRKMILFCFIYEFEIFYDK